MAVRPVVLYPDEPLTVASAPVNEIDKRLQVLIDDMLETMIEQEGVGLAAPQVGVAKRLFVLREPEGEPMCLINPEIVEAEGNVEAEEGCLSLPGIYYDYVPRAQRIRVRASDRHGRPVDMEAADLLARIIQHETDHLDGIIFLDRLDILTRQAMLHEWEELRATLQTAPR